MMHVKKRVFCLLLYNVLHSDLAFILFWFHRNFNCLMLQIAYAAGNPILFRAHLFNGHGYA